ncbi:Undecaprenyl-phosphate N-acetylglucosaminyl 1-phosphate transferase [Dissulfuribacter thermophilus]|uniref:Undecaprenyl-phosphate N-acetylglucosaminyl 1-phosphate transferase n=1 Tax=Dissulfuribacter thermophilus TaxID=1156395 RepID=A0A1B9F8P4_9BACT|nr:hypothetical protein [Dissulfuribacter thermophilus]OCC16280.1 Undecaprenyl-phosphate N-acetylglucosaminyl 1-phosphate transferase [Dissulfuribacter thermophilus]
MKQIFMDSGILFLMAFSLSALLTPGIIWASRTLNLVAQPREDRWHSKPTALFGGIGIFLAFTVPFAFTQLHSWQEILFLICASSMFLVGLIDDVVELTPQGKFLAQIAISAFIVAGGFRLNIGLPAISIVMSIFWVLAIVNAFNLLDNMDGLAAGIAVVSSLSFFVFGYISLKCPILLNGSVLLAGATLGFLIYNFHPARIFMGDCGSLFIGSVLAMLSIIGTWHCNSELPSSGIAGLTNLVLVLTVPVAILIVPIFDTALVSFTRTQNGRSIFKGGRDHTSHRLVLLGLSETKTVLLLMLWAACVSGLTIVLSRHSKEGLFVALALISIIALLFGIFLSHQTRFVYQESSPQKTLTANPVFREILNKKQMLQATLDTVLICLAYIASYLLRFEGKIDPVNMKLIEQTLPLIVAIKITSFWAVGLYRGQWRFVGIWDLFQLIKAVFASSLISMTILLFLYRFQGFSRIVFVNDAILTFLFIGGVRLLLRLFKEYFDMERERKHTIPILIIGAGDGGDLFLRELRKNPYHDYLPVGFIDDDPAKKGQIIHGVKVIGGRNDIPRLVKQFGIKKIFVAIMSISPKVLDEFYCIAQKVGVPCIKVPSLIPPKPVTHEAYGPKGKKIVSIRNRKIRT